MSIVYKLTEGLISREWRERHMVVSGNTLFYSNSLKDYSKKIVNLRGAFISHIMTFHDRKFCFSVVLPPFNSTVLYLSLDSYEEAVMFRRKVLEATENAVENEKKSFNDQVLNYSEKDLSNKAQEGKNLYNIEYMKNLEKLESEYISCDSFSYKKCCKAIHIYSQEAPKPVPFFKDLLWRILQVAVLMIIVSRCTKLLYSGGSSDWIIWIVALIIKISLRKIVLSFKGQACNYLVKSSTVIDAKKETIINYIKSEGLRKKWDNFLAEESSINFINDASAFFSFKAQFLFSRVTGVKKCKLDIVEIKSNWTYLIFRETNLEYPLRDVHS